MVVWFGALAERVDGLIADRFVWAGLLVDMLTGIELIAVVRENVNANRHNLDRKHAVYTCSGQRLTPPPNLNGCLLENRYLRCL
jgi:hypothetical protein